MAYTVSLKRSAEKELEKLPTKVHGKIINILVSLKESPFPRNSKSFEGGMVTELGLEIIEYSISLTNLTKT